LQETIEGADIDEGLKDKIAFQNVIPLIQKYNPGWSMPETPIRQHRLGEPGDLWAAEENNPVRLTGLS